MTHGLSRKFKRYEARMQGGHHVVAMYEAHCRGEWDALRGKPEKNPYPKGRRNREYSRSYQAIVEDGSFNCLRTTI